ncbi:MAG: DsrE family protein [Gemmatimonadota bacterium]|nr:DsrE family protein [Gemmatimonadota bacterium]
MKSTLVILNDPPYGSERTYNGLRLAGALAARNDLAVRVFLMGDAAACARKDQVVPRGFYNVNRMLEVLVRRSTPIGVCGTCMDARGLPADDLLPGTMRSTLDELARWTAEADTVIVF